MKRLVLICGTLVLFLSTSTMAADFLDSLRQYHVQVLRHLNIDTTNTSYLSTNQTYSFIREGIIAVVPPIRSNKAIRTYSMTYQNDLVALDSDVVGIIAVQFHKNDSTKSLLPIPKERWFQMEHRETNGKTGYEARPSYYAYVEGYLSLSPVPTNPEVDTLKVTVWVKAPNVLSASSFASIPTQYRIVILDYVTWRAAQAKGHPLWKDFRDNYFAAAKSLNATLGDPQITGTGVSGTGGTGGEVASPSSPAN